jgi:Sec-independent protein translocase protein TatA
MFGIGPQEAVVILLLLVVVFGPAKAAGIVSDLGHWVNEARRPVEEFKEELSTTTEEAFGHKKEKEPDPKKKEATV